MDITKGVPNRLISVGTPYYIIYTRVCAYTLSQYFNISIFPYFNTSIFPYLPYLYMFAMHMILAKTPAAVTLAPAP